MKTNNPQGITLKPKTILIGVAVLLSCLVLFVGGLIGTALYVVSALKVETPEPATPISSIERDARSVLAVEGGLAKDHAFYFGHLLKDAAEHVEDDLKRKGGVDTSGECGELIRLLGTYGVSDVKGVSYPGLPDFVKNHLLVPVIPKEDRQMSDKELGDFVKQLDKVGDAFLSVAK